MYIPFGWWHQIESSGRSVSISVRWNPYDHAIRQVMTARVALKADGGVGGGGAGSMLSSGSGSGGVTNKPHKLPPDAANSVFAELLATATPPLPKHVRDLLYKRYYQHPTATAGEPTAAAAAKPVTAPTGSVLDID